MPPRILQQPADTAVEDGQPLRLEVAAAGDPPLLHQWLRDGVPLPAECHAVLDARAVTSADSGIYSCQVQKLQVSARRLFLPQDMRRWHHPHAHRAFPATCATDLFRDPDLVGASSIFLDCIVCLLLHAGVECLWQCDIQWRTGYRDATAGAAGHRAPTSWLLCAAPRLFRPVGEGYI